MSTSAVPSPATSIDLNDSRLHTPPSPRPTLKRITADMADELRLLRLDAAAEAISNCGHHGVIHQRNVAQGKARAYRIVCHKWIDDYCGRPGNLLRAWLKKRDPAMLITPQSGLEITSPDAAKAAGTLATYFKRHGIDSMRRPSATGDRVRMVLKTRTVPLAKIRALVPGVRVELRHDSTPVDTLCWLFASTEGVLKIEDGRERARLFARWHGKRMLKATGKFYGIYHPAPGEEYKAPELSSEEVASGWENVPLEEQYAQPVERIEREWIVEWSSSYDAEWWKRVRNMSRHIANSEGRGQRAAQISACAASPPS